MARREYVEIDVNAFRRALKEAGFESLEEASLGLGMTRTYVTNLIRRGRCTLYTLDNVACKLDRHVSELVDGDMFAGSMQDEHGQEDGGITFH